MLIPIKEKIYKIFTNFFKMMFIIQWCKNDVLFLKNNRIFKFAQLTL